MKKATLAVVVVAVAVVSHLLASFGQSAKFSNVTGTVIEVREPGAHSVTAVIDAGAGGFAIVCYEGAKLGIRDHCLSLRPGDEVLLNGDLLIGSSEYGEWTEFLVTEVTVLSDWSSTAEIASRWPRQLTDSKYQ